MYLEHSSCKRQPARYFHQQAGSKKGNFLYIFGERQGLASFKNECFFLFELV